MYTDAKMTAWRAGLAAVAGLTQERLHGDRHLAVFELGHKIFKDVGTAGVTTAFIVSPLGFADEFSIQVERKPFA